MSGIDVSKALKVFVFLVAIAACSSEPAVVPEIKLDYSSLGKIYLNTQDVRVIDRSGSVSQKSPYVGHLFRPTLAEALNRWVQDRIQATGTAGHATFIIKEASVIERPLPQLSGIEGWFTREQASKYIGRIDVSLDAQSPVNYATGMATANATFAITLLENPTEAEKVSAYQQLLNGIMKDFNQKMEEAIRQHMAHFLVKEPSAKTEVLPESSLQ